jgi:glycosyltransferase involved in cell wall biosynthesis
MGTPEKRILAVIPAYNEAGRIGGVIRAIQRIEVPINVVVIDDGSKDKTAAVAREQGAKVVRLPFNLGYGAALQTGFRYALERGYEYVLQLDGDGQHDPREASVLLEKVVAGEVDLVIGSRFLGQGYRTSFVRRAGSVLFGLVTSWIIGQRITDPTSGYRAMNRRVTEFYTGERFPADFPDADVIIMLHRAGFRVAEAPIHALSASPKQSMHSGLKPLYYVLKMLLSIPLTLLRER